MNHPGADVPDTLDLDQLAHAATRCRGCDLVADATHTVFGAGDGTARLLLVGEQPGDREDLAGEPFVGPAGQVLDDALRRAGLADFPRWTTNAVKHFRFQIRGKRRIHQTPTASQSTACRPWLSAEIAAVRPAVIVALGATAAKSLYGPAFRLTQERGAALPWPPERGLFAASDVPATAFATIHPSAVLRADPGDRDDMFGGLVADLEVVRSALE